jgi:C-terminal processing protease CtpA/Prc
MRTRLAAGPLLFIASLAQAQTHAREASAEATRYLEAALDQIEQGSRVYATDWEAMRAKALATIAAAGAKTTADTYQAIRDALATVGDEHGLLLDPAAAKLFNPGRAAKATGLLVVPPDATVALVVPGSPAATAGLALGDRTVAVEGLAGFAELPHREFERLFRSGQRPDGSTAPLDLRVRTGTAEPRAVQVPLAAFDESLAPTGAGSTVTSATSNCRASAAAPRPRTTTTTLHELLDQIDDGTLRGCIIDLRRNTGGTLWPMLAGIGPLAGAGKVGAFVSAHGGADWSYDAEPVRRRPRPTSSPRSPTRIPCTTTCRSRCSPGR